LLLRKFDLWKTLGKSGKSVSWAGKRMVLGCGKDVVKMWIEAVERA